MIGVVSTGCVLFVIVVTSCVVCRKRDGRRRQRDNRRNSRTEALRGQNEATNVTSNAFEVFSCQNEAVDSRTEVLKALTSQSDNDGSTLCRPEVLTKPSTTTATSQPVKSSTSSVANGSASAATIAGYQPVSCLSPHTNKVSLFFKQTCQVVTTRKCSCSNAFGCVCLSVCVSVRINIFPRWRSQFLPDCPQI